MNNIFERHSSIDMHMYGEYLSHGGLCRPLMLICETVNFCNNDCIVCANSLMTRERKVMPMPLFRQVLDSYLDMGGGRLSLTPVVGDIFMDPSLMERLSLVREYRRKGITSVSVTTNAVLAKEYSDGELQEIVSSFDRIFISIYGRDQIEYKTMTRRDNFARMLESGRRMLGLTGGKDKVMLGFRLLKEYTEADITAWIKAHFGVALPFQAMNMYANWGRIDTSQALPLGGKWLPTVENTGQCFIPLLAMQVFSSGQVSFCSCNDYDADEELLLGHITDAPLLQIYNSGKVRRLWDFGSHVPAFCRMCSFHRPVDQLGDFGWIFERPLDFIGG